jgi:hypothetical protein
MFNSSILDLIIFLSFTYFIGSLMLSAINESIAAGLQTRAKDLKKTLQNLLFDSQWKTFVKGNIFESQHIKSLMNNAKQFPSYIPAQNFILTIIEQIGQGNYTKQNITAGINNSPLPASMKNVLHDLWQKAQANISATQTEMAAFEKEIENYYNNAMERATGWYKRKIRRILLIMGFVLAAFLNIDTIKITNDALKDKKRLAEAVDKIVDDLPALQPGQSVTVNASGDSATITESTDTSLVRLDSLGKATTDKIKNLKISYNEKGGYKMGYEASKYFNDWWNEESGLLGLFLKILGLIITAFALQLGSNYWFDLLNKAVNMRATGKKPNEEKT